MKHVVITGSTRGIGFGLASAFLKRGHQVTINGSDQVGVDTALAKLHESFPNQSAQGFAADVADVQDLEMLWDKASEKLGDIDIWINNAGRNQQTKFSWDLDPARLEETIKTNILGVIHGSHVAFRHMLRQGHGQIYNMEGLGSDGRIMDKTIIYGTTKSAVAYFTRGLSREARGTCVQVGALRPGMVMTDFLTTALPADEQEATSMKRIMNILADPVKPVTEFLCEKILKNRNNGAKIHWVSTLKIMGKFLAAPFNRRDYFS